VPESSEGKKAVPEMTQDVHLLKGSELAVEKIHKSPMASQNKLVMPKRDIYVQYFRANMPVTEPPVVAGQKSGVLALDESDDHQPLRAGTSQNSTGDRGHQLQVRALTLFN
jgi:hypothetical protein